MSSGKFDNTKLLAIMIGTIVVVGVIGIVAIAIYAPADQSFTLITTVTGFIMIIIPLVFNLFKTQAVIDQVKEDTSLLHDQSHNHKVGLALQIQETKEIVEQTKEVAIEAKEASKKAEHVANNVNEKIKNSLALRREDNKQQERQNDRLDRESDRIDRLDAEKLKE